MEARLAAAILLFTLFLSTAYGTARVMLLVSGHEKPIPRTYAWFRFWCGHIPCVWLCNKMSVPIGFGELSMRLIIIMLSGSCELYVRHRLSRFRPRRCRDVGIRKGDVSLRMMTTLSLRQSLCLLGFLMLVSCVHSRTTESARSPTAESVLAELMVATNCCEAGVSGENVSFLGLRIGMTKEELSGLYMISPDLMGRLCQLSSDGRSESCHVYVSGTGLGKRLGVPFGLVDFLTSHDVGTGRSHFVLVKVYFSDPGKAWNLYDYVVRSWLRAGRRVEMSQSTPPYILSDLCLQSAELEGSTLGDGVRISCLPDSYVVQVTFAGKAG